MSGALDRKVGGTSLVQASADGASGAPGKRTLTEQLGGGAPATYTVKAGENLATIAAALGTTVDALKAANAGKLRSFPTRSGGTVQGFNAGDVLAVPTAVAAAPAPAPAAPAPSAPTAAPQGGGMLDGLFGTVGGALHEAWDFVTGRNGAPAAAVDEHAATGDGHAASTAKPTGHTGATTSAPPAGKAEPSAPAATSPGVPGTAPLAELSDAQRGEQLSTFHADELGAIDKFEMSKTGRDGAKQRGQWLTANQVYAAGAGKSGKAYVDSVDALVDKTKFSEQQDEIISSAREFASAPKALTPAQESKAAIDWSKALLSLDGVALNDDLKARLVKYVRFLAWAGLVTGPSVAGSVMRSPQQAHKLSVAWMFNLAANTSGGSTLHTPDHRKALVKTVTDKGGSDVDGNKWLSDATVEGLKAKQGDDDALFDYIKTTAAPEASKVQTQRAIAAEGYKTADKRHPNVLGGTSVSNHLLGEAVDLFPPFVFNNKFDPMIDAIAMYFGLWRAVKDNSASPEHWHYERLGIPPGAEPEAPH